MAAKRLEPDSEFSAYDLNNDQVVSDDELLTSERLSTLKSQTDKAVAQKNMAWFSLWGMLLYPTLIVFCSLVKLEQAAQILSEIAPVYFVSTAGLCASYFGASAWATRKQ